MTTIFNVFFRHWTRAVVAERFEEDAQPLLTAGAEALAARLLSEDRCSWFANRDRDAHVISAFDHTLEDLTQRFGSDMTTWGWGIGDAQLEVRVRPGASAGIAALGTGQPRGSTV